MEVQGRILGELIGRKSCLRKLFVGIVIVLHQLKRKEIKLIRNCVRNYLNIFLPSHLEFHHIDCNPKNNTFKNIIVLEKKFHKKVHRLIKSTMPELKQRFFLHRYMREQGIARYWLDEVKMRKKKNGNGKEER